MRAPRPEPLEPRAREHDRVVVARVELGQPRVDVAAQVDQFAGPGRSARNCAWRRSDEVPTRAPCGSSSRRANALLTNASAGRRARASAAIAKPGSSSIGTSLSECTAKSARPSLHRDFEFLEEQALAADRRERAIERFVAARGHRHQLDREPGMRARKRAATCSVCQSASALLRVAMRSALQSERTSLRSARQVAPADFERRGDAGDAREHAAVGRALESRELAPARPGSCDGCARNDRRIPLPATSAIPRSGPRRGRGARRRIFFGQQVIDVFDRNQHAGCRAGARTGACGAGRARCVLDRCR